MQLVDYIEMDKTQLESALSNQQNISTWRKVMLKGKVLEQSIE